MSLGDPQQTIVFWQSKEVVGALTGMGSAVVNIIHSIKEKDYGLMVANVSLLGSLAYWFYTRLKRGKDPVDPAPRVTLTQVPKV